MLTTKMLTLLSVTLPDTFLWVTSQYFHLWFQYFQILVSAFIFQSKQENDDKTS